MLTILWMNINAVYVVYSISHALMVFHFPSPTLSLCLSLTHSLQGVGDLIDLSFPEQFLKGTEKQRALVTAVQEHLKKANFQNFNSLLQAFRHYDKVTYSDLHSSTVMVLQIGIIKEGPAETHEPAPAMSEWQWCVSGYAEGTRMVWKGGPAECLWAA